MGMMNWVYFRDKDANAIGNVFSIVSDLNHHAHSGGQVFHDHSEENLRGDRKGKRMLAAQEHLKIPASQLPHMTHPHHTSAKGAMIVTTDYMIDLPFSVPEDLTPEELVDWLGAKYRKEIIRKRHLLRQDAPEIVTRRKILESGKAFEKSLPETASPGEDIGHLVAIDFDCLHDYEGIRGDKATQHVRDAYWKIMEQKNDGNFFVGRMERMDPSLLSLTGQAMLHWVSLAQDEMLILNFHHLIPTYFYKVGRSRRTVPEELIQQMNEHPLKDAGFHAIFANEFILMREFFRSQGMEIRL